MTFKECEKINLLMENFNKNWFIAGGWALDLYIGRKTRHHEDIEIGIFRKDQLYLKNYFDGWKYKKVVNGQFYEWGDEFLELPIHEIYIVNEETDEHIEILLNEFNNNEWIYRRDLRISKSLNTTYSYTELGIPYLNPEIVLLFKTSHTREKDNQDFEFVINQLDDKKRAWLSKNLKLTNPNHQWNDYL
ncbi:nucleotidyltransferase domain-containing protein [Mammaliicoccus sciuri]|uniref:nucleotidyltransferase domain-containing protein n=1 Tax=Mammaliicoccus sciuri TaxID=1296 RepID=UPI003F56D65C